MDIKQINIHFDKSNITLSGEHSSFFSEMYMKVDDYVFPHLQYYALPGMIFRWLLKEMRLIGGKNNTLKERHIYFYPETEKFIVLEYLGDGVLSVKFVKRKIQNKGLNILHTVFSKEGQIEEEKVYCLYNDFFLETYKQAEMFFNLVRNLPRLGGDILVLEEELRLSKKTVNKILKSNGLRGAVHGASE